MLSTAILRQKHGEQHNALGIWGPPPSSSTPLPSRFSQIHSLPTTSAERYSQLLSHQLLSPHNKRFVEEEEEEEERPSPVDKTDIDMVEFGSPQEGRSEWPNSSSGQSSVFGFGLSSLGSAGEHTERLSRKRERSEVGSGMESGREYITQFRKKRKEKEGDLGPLIRIDSIAVSELPALPLFPAISAGVKRKQSTMETQALLSELEQRRNKQLRSGNYLFNGRAESGSKTDLSLPFYPHRRGKRIYDIKALHNGTNIMTSCTDGTFKLWDAATLEGI